MAETALRQRMGVSPGHEAGAAMAPEPQGTGAGTRRRGVRTKAQRSGCKGLGPRGCGSEAIERASGGSEGRKALGEAKGLDDEVSSARGRPEAHRGHPWWRPEQEGPYGSDPERRRTGPGDSRGDPGGRPEPLKLTSLPYPGMAANLRQWGLVETPAPITVSGPATVPGRAERRERGHRQAWGERPLAKRRGVPVRPIQPRA